ncbi:hypothetical protein SH139x_003726 [Planctomycetaceae bacterium SH139]
MTADAFSTQPSAQRLDSLLLNVKFRHPELATARLEKLRESANSTDLAAAAVQHVASHLVNHPAADPVFAWFVEMICQAAEPQRMLSHFQQNPDKLTQAIRLVSSSAWIGECLLSDPQALELLQLTGVEQVSNPVARTALVEQFATAAQAASSVSQANEILRQLRNRELLRVGFGDVVSDAQVDRTCEQLAYVADAILSAALDTAYRFAVKRRGEPRIGDDGRPVSLTVLAHGPYGGLEMDYGQAIDVLMLAGGGQAGATSQAPVDEFVELWIETTKAILQGTTPQSTIYRLRQRLNEDASGKLIYDAETIARSLDHSGRTWQRQALVKARVAAGDQQLGAEWMRRIEPWVYRRYLGAADQEGIRAVRRKLSRGTGLPAAAEQLPIDAPLIASGEIEGVTQFLRLLNGTDLNSLRVGNTFRAIEALEQAGCLTMQERTLLSEHYAGLRKIAHRLQLASLAEANGKPDSDGKSGSDEEPWTSAAHSLGFVDAAGHPDPHSLRNDTVQRRRVTRRIVDHLVHDVFPDSEEMPLETEMVLDPEIDRQVVERTLSGYGFERPEVAFQQLLSMATEQIRFLSDRRSRHFLAGIAPKLLEEVAATPDPDTTLERLAAISDSLGGKAALWELFQSTPPTLRLCVRLCAASPYLAGILVNNPGMLDELIDSLILDRLPLGEQLENNSRELCRFAEDLDPILHSFKNSAQLRIGVRDLLGRDSIVDTHRAIADTAEACLRRVAEYEWEMMTNRYGIPMAESGQPGYLSMIALGKLGGREPNYHSDLDMLFVYDAEGQTRPLAGGRREGTSNGHFFNELTQRINKRVSNYGPWGRLYDLDGRIRFSHHRHVMAITQDQFAAHFGAPGCPLWQRLALVNARVIYHSGANEKEMRKLIAEALQAPAWRTEMAEEAAKLRYQSQQGAAPENLKRGLGGTLDIELIVQLLLLRHAGELAGQLGVGTFAGLQLLRKQGWLSVERARHLSASYNYLRSVESNLRLMNLPARHDLPRSPDELRWLAFAMRETHANVVTQKCDAYREANRQIFEAVIAEQMSGDQAQQAP